MNEKPSTAFAEALNGTNIGDTVSFQWEFPKTFVMAQITGDIQEIHHTPDGRTTLWIVGKGVGSEEFVLDEAATVEFV